MSNTLFLKYRPSEFKDLVGQRLNAAVLSKMVQTEKLYQGMLFTGPSGCGKTSAARILAHSLGYDGAKITEIDAASNRGVENVRILTDALRYGSGQHVIILDEAHNLTREAFNALLKTLEEPVPGTVFILLTTEPGKIPDTVKSRLMEFEFRRIPTPGIFERLLLVAGREDISVEEKLLTHIAETSDGNLRTALTSLEFVQLAEISTVEDYREALGDSDFAPTLVRAMLTGDHSSIFAEVDSVLSRVADPSHVSSGLLSFFRDLLIIRSGGKEYDEERKRLSVEIPREELMAVVKVLWDLRTLVAPSEDKRGSLELAVILMSGILSKVQKADDSVINYSKPATNLTKVRSGQMTLTDMRNS